MAGKSVVVIGAGLSGLTAAKSLLGSGVNVVVLDKGWRVGGRCTTRRFREHDTGIDESAADIGAQFFPAPAKGSKSAFAEIVNEWRSAGLIASANVQLVHLNPDVENTDENHPTSSKSHIVALELEDPGEISKKSRFFFTRRWQKKDEHKLHGSHQILFVPHRRLNLKGHNKSSNPESINDTGNAEIPESEIAGINSLAEHLELKIKEMNGIVHTNIQVQNINCKNGKWTINANIINRTFPEPDSPESDSQTIPFTKSHTFEADGVIITSPVPQSLELLRHGEQEIPLPNHIEARLNRIKYDPCLTVLQTHQLSSSASLSISRLIGIHILNGIFSLAPTSTPATAPLLTWIGLQSAKRIAESDTLRERWIPSIKGARKAVKAVGEIIRGVDIISAMAAGSGGFIPPPAVENSSDDKSAPDSEQQATQPTASTAATTENEVAETEEMESETIVLQADPVYSARMYDATDEEIAASLRKEAQSILETAISSNSKASDDARDSVTWWNETPVKTIVKKWRYANCVIPDDPTIDQVGQNDSTEGCIAVNLGAPLVFAGDAFGYRAAELGNNTAGVETTHAENAAVMAVASAAHSHVLDASAEKQEIESKDEKEPNADAPPEIPSNIENENDVVVWSGFGSEVGGFGVEAAILSGSAAAKEILKRF